MTVGLPVITRTLGPAVFILILAWLPLLPVASTEVNAAQTDTSQTDTSKTAATDSLKRQIHLPPQSDTAKRNALLRSIERIDTNQSVLEGKRSGGIDSIVNFSAIDSATYYIRSRRAVLNGSAALNYREMKLNAESIGIQFDELTLRATAGRDSSGRLFGIPNFSDGGERFYGEAISYNFRSRKGTISLGETVIDNGYYFGDKIKRVDENTLFVQNGCYTTCDKPHPHFYFKSSEMKVLANDRIFADPLIVYVEDLPVFMLPFGVFFENKSGRRSGIMIPSFFFSGSPGTSGRGIVFEDLGYYWATSEYFDTRIYTDISTKGGFQLYNDSYWRVGDDFSGSLALSYGRTRQSTALAYRTNWGFRLNHRHTLDPQTKVNADVNFYSEDFNRQTSNDLDERIRQNVRSSATFQKNFDNGTFLSLTYNRDQDLISGRVNSETLPNISYSIPQFYPLRSLVSRDSWISDISLRASLSGVRSRREFEAADGGDSSFVSQRISYAPSISIAPKLGYFSISPSIRTGGDFVFRSLKKTYNAGDSSVTDTFVDGLHWIYDYSFSLTVSTKLYGIAYPRIFGINAIRHILNPSVSFTYTPDFSDPSFGYYDSYYDEARRDTVYYNRFQADGVSVGRGLVQSMRFSLGNTFEAKIAQADTAADKPIQLFTFNVDGAYNFAADSLRFSEIATSLRTSAAGIFNVTAAARFNLYKQLEVRDDVSGTTFYRTINRFLAEENEGLARLVNASIRLSTSLSSRGFSTPAAVSDVDTNTSRIATDFGSRFRARDENLIERNDVFGDSSPGYSPLDLRWDLAFDLNFSYNSPNPANITRRLNINTTFNFWLTQYWRVRTGFNYDFIENELLIPSIGISRQLHCWELSFNWTPTGFSRGFRLQLNVIAPQLKDLKIEKQDSPLYR